MWGYICVPNSNNINYKTLEHIWKESSNIQKIYTATATFSLEGKSYFPNYSNYYLLASFSDFEYVKKELNEYSGDKMSFVFFKKKLLFQTTVLAKLNYLSIYFIKQSYDQDTLDEMEYVFLRRR